MAGGARPLLTVGLTGGIASGKSTVDAMFEELGAEVIDADQIVHGLLAAGGGAVPAVLGAFGPTVASRDGGVDRAALAAIVFADPRARLRLEGLVHPLVSAEIDRRLDAIARADGPEIVLIDAALLVETGADRRFDRLVVVACREETQLARLVASRELSPDEALRRVRAQCPSSSKAVRADYTIENDGELEATRARVRDVHRALVLDLEAKKNRKETWNRRPAG